MGSRLLLKGSTFLDLGLLALARESKKWGGSCPFKVPIYAYLSVRYFLDFRIGYSSLARTRTPPVMT